MATNLTSLMCDVYGMAGIFIHDGMDAMQHQGEKENWLKFYVNPYSGRAEAELTEPVELNQANLEVKKTSSCSTARICY